MSLRWHFATCIRSACLNLCHVVLLDLLQGDFCTKKTRILAYFKSHSKFRRYCCGDCSRNGVRFLLAFHVTWSLFCNVSIIKPFFCFRFLNWGIFHFVLWLSHNANLRESQFSKNVVGRTRLLEYCHTSKVQRVIRVHILYFFLVHPTCIALDRTTVMLGAYCISMTLVYGLAVLLLQRREKSNFKWQWQRFDFY